MRGVSVLHHCGRGRQARARCRKSGTFQAEPSYPNRWIEATRCPVGVSRWGAGDGKGKSGRGFLVFLLCPRPSLVWAQHQDSELCGLWGWVCPPMVWLGSMCPCGAPWLCVLGVSHSGLILALGEDMEGTGPALCCPQPTLSCVSGKREGHRAEAKSPVLLDPSING